jgi:hypothetical protein
MKRTNRISQLAAPFPAHTTVPVPETFSCPVCGESFSVRGFTRHLARCCPSHGLTLEDYERLHSTRLYGPFDEFAAKWFSLAAFSIREFGLMKYLGCYWFHVNTREPRDSFQAGWGRKPETLPLVRFKDGRALLKQSFHQFRRHLMGDLTLAIWPDMDNRFTIIDLDDDQARRRRDVTARLIDLNLSFRIEFSGGKGYHFWVFWDRILTNSELLRVQAFLLDGIPADTKCWPYKRGLIKLPLGLHRRTWNLACFLDYTGAPIPLEQQFDYFLNIRQNPVPPAFLQQTEAPSTVHPSKRSDSNTDSDRKSPREAEGGAPSGIYEQCLALGTKLPDGRHHTLFLLAVYLKNERKLSKHEARTLLSDWSRRVSSKHSVKDRLRDVSSTVSRVYATSIRITQYERAELSPEEQRVITDCVSSSLNSVIGFVGSGVRKEDVGKRLKTATKVALVLASLVKATGGTLEVGCRALAKEAGVSKNALRRALDVLVSDEIPPPENIDEYDPVVWNFDTRPLRRGGPFECVSRGSFPQFDRSVYRLRTDARVALCWPAVTVTTGCAPGGQPFVTGSASQAAGSAASGGACPPVRFGESLSAPPNRTDGQPSPDARQARISSAICRCRRNERSVIPVAVE